MMKHLLSKYARFGLVFTLMAIALAGCGGSDDDDVIVGVATRGVTYNGNDQDGGSVPVDDTVYQEGQTVTVLGNTGVLYKAGYTYTGWNTQADGTGTTYTQDQTFTMGAADVILYALWTTAPTFTVTYTGNGADGGAVPVDTNHYAKGQSVTVLGNSGNLVRAGYIFEGWNTQADGSGTTYQQGVEVTMGTIDVTFYAEWTPTSASGLDTSFGDAGVLTTPSDGMAYAVAIQEDGKILVAGDGASVVRYEANGDLDPEFGTDGIATLPAGFWSIRGMAIQSNGKIVVAGIGSSGGYFRMAAARLNLDGSLDTTSFGSGGIFYSPFTSNGSYGAQGVAIQDDGKIVLAGETGDKFAVVRLTIGGVLDNDPTTGFGPAHNGYVTTVIQDFSHATAVAIQEDGKIVVTGQSYLGPPGAWSNYAASVARYQTNGTLDIAGWGGGAGYILSTFITDPTDLAIQNGRIVIAGGHLVDSHNEFAMLGFDANGWLDNTFGDGGFVTTYLGDSATAYAIAVSDDEILLAGHALVGFDALLAVARYTANGTLDTTFGNANGYEFTEVGDSPYAYGLAIQPSDGKIVVAGGQGMGSSSFFVARYLP